MLIASCHPKEASNANHLGVTMNTRLSWKKHVHEICGKANQTRQFWQRNLVACKPETKLQCYKTFVRPIVEYSSSVWDSSDLWSYPGHLSESRGKSSLTFPYTLFWGHFYSLKTVKSILGSSNYTMQSKSIILIPFL